MWCYTNLMIILTVCIHIPVVYSQAVVISEQEPYQYVCEQPLTLKCSVSGIACCNTSTRIWRKDTLQIMSNGVETTISGKYSEQISNAENYFTLKINNLNKEDLENEFVCSYSVYTSLSFKLEHGKLYCFYPKCWLDGFQYLLAGHGISTILLLILVCVLRYGGFWKDCKWSVIVILAAVYFIISFVLNFVIAGTASFHGNFCSQWLILIGVLAGAVGSLISFAYFKIRLNTENHSLQKFKYDARILVSTAVEVVVIGICVALVVRYAFEGQCDICGWKSFGWAVLGSVIVGAVVFFCLCLKCVKKVTSSRSIIFGLVIIVKSAVVSIVVAVPYGIYICPCTGWTNPFFIFLGFVYALILLVVMWPLLDAHDDIPLIVLLCFGGTGIGFIGIFFYVCRKAKGNKEDDPTGGNNRSKESGSSCWPPCSVGPDPNSPESENARSLLKKNADKKNEKKPVAVVRSQPPKNRHVKTDNTESTRYSAETEIFDEGVHKSAKSRPLPSIGQPTISPRPLPQMPPSSQLEKGGIQLEPLGDSTSEKKKKKRRKKKESKQSGDED